MLNDQNISLKEEYFEEDAKEEADELASWLQIDLVTLL